MFRRTVMAASAAAALSLALTACGNDSGSGSGDPVAWAEKVCKSVEGDVAALTQQPEIDPSDPAKAKEGMVVYLGKLSTALGHMASGIRDAGTVPIAEAAPSVEDVTKSLDDAKKTIDDAKTNLESAPVDNPEAWQEAYDKVGEDLVALSGLEDPTKDLESNQQLKDAFDKAPTCQKIDQGSSGTPPTS